MKPIGKKREDKRGRSKSTSLLCNDSYCCYTPFSGTVLFFHASFFFLPCLCQHELNVFELIYTIILSLFYTRVRRMGETKNIIRKRG